MEDWDKKRKEILHGKLWLYAALVIAFIILYWLGKMFKWIDTAI
jgi:hypothetical protein